MQSEKCGMNKWLNNVSCLCIWNWCVANKCPNVDDLWVRGEPIFKQNFKMAGDQAGDSEQQNASGIPKAVFVVCIVDASCASVSAVSSGVSKKQPSPWKATKDDLFVEAWLSTPNPYPLRPASRSVRFIQFLSLLWALWPLWPHCKVHHTTRPEQAVKSCSKQNCQTRFTCIHLLCEHCAHMHTGHNPKIGENQKWKFSFFHRK